MRAPEVTSDAVEPRIRRYDNASVGDTPRIAETSRPPGKRRVGAHEVPTGRKAAEVFENAMVTRRPVVMGTRQDKKAKFPALVFDGFDRDRVIAVDLHAAHPVVDSTSSSAAR